MAQRITALHLVLVLSSLASGACGGDEGSPSATGGSAGTGGQTGGNGGAASGGGTTTPVPTPMGTLFMDDFESGSGKWDVTQGTCLIAADDSNVYQCTKGGNEARALAGEIGWGEYTVQARIKINAMDPGRRIYLAGRFTDSNNWYGAAFYNDTPPGIQLRKKVDGSSADIISGTYPFEMGTWYTVKLELKGSTLRMYVDDLLQLEAMDTSFASGRIALLVDRSDVSFDDVLVTNP